VLEPSIISLSGACQYAADKLALPPLSGRGVSNAGSGAVFLESDQPFMVLT